MTLPTAKEAKELLEADRRCRTCGGPPAYFLNGRYWCNDCRAEANRPDAPSEVPDPMVSDEPPAGRALRWVEPVMLGDDDVGAVDPWGGRWDPEELGLPNVWPLPPLPSRADFDGLRDDVIDFIRDHVDLHEERRYAAVADWVLATYLPEPACAPRLYFQAPTVSGKTRMMDVLWKLAYRAWKVILPTGPTLYRTVEQHRVTAMVDEYQGLGDEAKTAVNTVANAGFEPGVVVPRCNRAHQVEYYDTFSFMAIASKEWLPEDVLNRGIPTNMRARSREVAREVDKERARFLRGRLLAWRFALLRGDAVLDPDGVRKVLDGKTMDDDDAVSLGDRAYQSACVLLLPALAFGDDGAKTLSVLKDAEVKADEELQQTPEAKVARAILKVAKQYNGEDFLFRKVREQFLYDLESDDGWDPKEADREYKPQKVSWIVRQTLGFDTEIRGGKSWVKRSDIKLESLRQRYMGGTQTGLDGG